MADTVEAGGVALRVEEAGAGVPVVLVHGTATDRSLWSATVAALGGAVRTIAYDRRGYGDSEAPEPYGGTTIGEQADDLADLLRTLDATPATLCGHEFGALVCIDVLARHADAARAAVLLDPSILWLSRRGPDAIADVRDAVASAARERGPAGAVDAFLAQFGGAELLGPERLERAHADVRAFAADLAAAASWPGGRRELRAIDRPVTVVSGRRSPPVFREVARSLADVMPRASLVEVDAGHLAQIEAPAAVAEAVASLSPP